MLNNVKMQTKMALIVGIALLFVIVVGSLGYYYTISLAGKLNQMYEERLQPVKWMGAINTNSRHVEGIVMELVAAPVTVDRRKALQDEMKRIAAVSDQNMYNYERLALSDGELERLEQIKAMMTIVRAERQKAVQIANQGEHRQAYAYYLTNVVENLNHVNSLRGELLDHLSQTAENVKEEGRKYAAFANMFILWATAAALILLSILGWLLTKSIVNPLMALSAEVREVAKGNLAFANTGGKSDDEIGQLAAEFGTMTNNLRSLVRNVVQTAEQLAASSEEMSAGAEQSAQTASEIAATIGGMASGVQEQSAAVNSTVIVVEKISEEIQHAAGNAGTVTELAEKTVAAASSGETAVNASVSQMGSIEQSVAAAAEVVTRLGERSREIGQIIDTISGIASQTNLLALNAAIEAARAGEQGRGFAVVAEEVRKLAEQSGVAAMQVSDLILHVQSEAEKSVIAMNSGTAEVKKGAEVVAIAGHAFKDIAILTGDVSERVKEISGSIHQISDGSRQVVAAIRDVDQISQASSGQTRSVAVAIEEQTASVEEIAAASRALSEMAEALQNAVQKFTL